MNNKQLSAKVGLNWRRAYYAMLSGNCITRPSWKGYWSYEKSPKGDMSVMMHTLEGDVIDIRDTLNVPYTLENTVQKDWIVLSPDEAEKRRSQESVNG